MEKHYQLSLSHIDESNLWVDILSRSQFLLDHVFCLSFFLSFQSPPFSGLSLVHPAAETDERALWRESVTRGRRKATVQAPTALATTQRWAGSALDQGGSGT